MASILDKQSELGLSIEKAYTNFKKDSLSRKTQQYLIQHKQALEQIWSQFDANHARLQSIPELDVNHNYFTKKFYKVVKLCREDYLGRLNALFKAESSNQTQDTLPPPQEPNLTNHLEIQERQIDYMVEMAESIDLQHEYPHGYYTAMLSALSSQWNDIQQTHCIIMQIHPQHNVSKYYAAKNVYLKASVHCQSKNVLIPSPEQFTRVNNCVRLAPVTVPTFDGTYSQWTRFQQMFEEAVGTQPITNIQKLIHLKGSLRDAALNLVNHLPVTDANFQTAWNILETRYNNKYLITTEFLDKIISYPKSHGESSSFIRRLHDTVIECVGALNNIGLPTEHWDAILHHLVIKKVDSTTYSLYRQTLAAPRELHTLNNLLNFLELRFQSLEVIEPMRNKGSAIAHTKSSLSTSKTTLLSSETSSRPQPSTLVKNTKQFRSICIMCKASHPLYSCSNFRRLSETERYKKVKAAGLCINCLKEKHNSAECPSRSCFKCNKAHHTLLHFEQASDTTTNLSASLTGSTSKKGYTLLATAVIEIMDKTKKPVNCRVLLDSGSQLSFITERMLRKLKLSWNSDHIEISGLGNAHIKSCKRTVIDLQSKTTKYATSLDVCVIPSITSDQPSRSINIKDWPIPNNIKLADPQFNHAAPVDLLIGAELFISLISVGQIKMSHDLPSLQNTVLGWVVLGKTSCSEAAPTFCGISTHSDDVLENQLRRFWEIEELTSTKQPMTLSEKLCEENFNSTVQRNSEGRFIVKLPFITDPSTLGNSEDMAIRRFKSLERRLEKTPEVKREYALFINEYIDLQHMEEVTRESIGNHHFILPHHCVLRPDSSTTKLRVVFDGSAKTSNSKSLNDLLAVGPTIQKELFSILLRFRKYKYVFTTDIQKMYRQILVNETDQNYQVILWRNNPREDIKYYRLKTVTYGTRSAPYLATKCIQYLAELESDLHPFGSVVAIRDIYVDDIMTGSDSLHQLMATQSQIIHLLQLGGFQLHKWCSNANQLLKYIPAEHQEFKHEIDKNDQTKTLGLIWLPKRDQFIIKASRNHSTHITKRTVLSDLAQLFDPLGLISPVTVTAKIFMQNLWALDLQWDAALPMNLHTKWQQFREELLMLNELQIPRHMLVQSPTQIQLHAFSDASEKAYGTAIYLRSTNALGELQAHLVCSKSRVAPRKTTTIPRLELCAAKLMCDVVHRIKTDLDLQIDSTHYWTDSTIVLSWIKADSTSFKTFVANRVAEIQTLSQTGQWHHIPTQLNPADLVSRGVLPRALLTSSFWFNGPEFLKRSENHWPCEQQPIIQIHEEEKSVAVSLTISESNDNTIAGIDHRNNYKFVQRVLAFVLRFTQNCKRQRNARTTDSSLTLQEINAADMLIIKYLQQKAFSSELSDLKRGKQCHRGSKLTNLSPFLDQHQIIRVGGRLEQSALQFDSKHQIVLPSSEPLVKLMVHNLHIKHLHAGPQALLAIVRQRLWPIHGKQLTKKIVQQCMTCFRDKPTMITQVMGNLPADRIQQSRPFSHVGVDFAGPINIHYKLRGKRPTKAYICVYVCFATKAVHLEVASDLSTLAFIACLKRFIARRGRPAKIFSDNATNFIGARNDLHELQELVNSDTHQTAVTNHCTDNGIEWNLIPPRSPHFGGLWEAAVKSAKLHLRKLLHAQQLTYEELNTVVTEIEAILNSRPITPMSNDPNDLQALTPGHFLIGEPVTAINDSTLATPSLQKIWSKMKAIKHEFWQRWSKEYLHELQYRNKWTKETEHLAVNSLVLLRDSNRPPLSWHMGRVTDVHKGNDGRVRVVDIKTASGTTKRAIHTICPLPLESNNIVNNNDLEASKSRAKFNESQFRKNVPRGPKPKKMRIYPATFLALCCCMFFTTVESQPFKKTPFEHSPGLYFEDRGKASFTNDDWKIVTYINLQGYWQEQLDLKSLLNKLNSICPLATSNNFNQLYCEVTMEQLHHQFDVITSKNQLIDNSRQGRNKRGLINIIGTAAKTLFGTLDDNDAQYYEAQINLLQKNDKHILELLKVHTSIEETTKNIVKKNNELIYRQFQLLEKEISNLKQTKNLDAFQMFTSLALHILIIISGYQDVQNNILDILLHANTGKLHSALITTDQIRTQLSLVQKALPEHLMLPWDGEENLSELYSIMYTEGCVTKQNAIISIRVPIISRETFQIHHLIPVPALHNNQYTFIQPHEKYLLSNLKRDQFSFMTPLELSQCTTFKHQKICKQIKPINNVADNNAPCELNLLNQIKNIPSSCIIGTSQPSQVWIQLSTSNTYIYSLDQEYSMKIIYNGSVTTAPIAGSGIIELSQHSIIEIGTIEITAHNTHKQSDTFSLPAIANISQLLKPNIQISSTQSVTLNNQNDMEHLEEQLSHLKTAESMDLPITQHDIHQYITIYLVIAVLVFCSIFYCFRNKIRSVKTNQTPNTNPDDFELRDFNAGEC